MPATFGSKIRFFKLELSSPLSDDAIGRVDLFRQRSQELYENWESLRRQGIKLGGGFSNDGAGVVRGPSCGIEIHRLKGFYLDFRCFHAKSEPTNYFKIARLLCSHSDDIRLRNCLKRDKSHWNDVDILQAWHGWNPDMLMDVLFNGSLFHADAKKRAMHLNLSQAMKSELAHYFLTYCVYSRMLVIRRLHWMMEPLSLENRSEIRVPAEFAQRAD